MRVVLDTNVIVSGLNYSGNEHLVVDLALKRRFQLYISQFILDEAADVLLRKFGWDTGLISENLATIINAAVVIDPPPLPPTLHPDNPDNRILECVVAADAEFLVTGDHRHLLPLRRHHTAMILSAPGFLSSLREA